LFFFSEGLRLGLLDAAGSVDRLVEKNHNVYSFGDLDETAVRKSLAEDEHLQGHSPTSDAHTKNPVWAKDEL
jgi:hypothetical protein